MYYPMFCDILTLTVYIQRSSLPSEFEVTRRREYGD
jgi:hypothetical protein